MKTLSRLIVLFVLMVAALCAMSSVALGASRLTFADEFSGPLNAANWTNDTPWNTHYTTGESQWYDPADSTFASGMMTLRSENRAMNGYQYTSGIVTSLPHAKFSYGYFEIRAKLPKGPGLWPAFWLTNDHSLEIDGFEVLGNQPDRVYMTLHEYDVQTYQGIKNGIDTSADFHTYGIDWQPDHVKWYIDGVECAAVNKPMPPDPMWLCMNTTVGGSWSGMPTSATTFPADYVIDYVHVYDTRPLPNSAPVAVGDSYSTANATALTLSAPGVLANDSDAENDVMSAIVSMQPSHGTVSMSADGAFTYTPDAGFAGIDSFAYQAYDGAAYSAPASVSIGVADPHVFGPYAMADTYSTSFGMPLEMASMQGVLANDTDTMGRAMTAVIVLQPAHGTLSLAADGSFSYTSAPGYSGSDSFTYIAVDGTAVSNATDVTLNVTAPAVVPTVATVPVIKVQSRAHRTYRAAGAIHLGSLVQLKTRVLLTVQVQRLLYGKWRAYRTARMLNPATNYKTVIQLRSGKFRARALVSVAYKSAATSAWSKAFRVR